MILLIAQNRFSKEAIFLESKLTIQMASAGIALKHVQPDAMSAVGMECLLQDKGQQVLADPFVWNSDHNSLDLDRTMLRLQCAQNTKACYLSNQAFSNPICRIWMSQRFSMLLFGPIPDEARERRDSFNFDDAGNIVRQGPSNRCCSRSA